MNYDSETGSRAIQYAHEPYLYSTAFSDPLHCVRIREIDDTLLQTKGTCAQDLSGLAHILVLVHR